MSCLLQATIFLIELLHSEKQARGKKIVHVCLCLCVRCVCKCTHESNNYVCPSVHMCASASGRESGCQRESTRENKGLKELSRVRQTHKVSVNRSLLREGHLCIVC